jgi:hypothetical protein
MEAITLNTHQSVYREHLRPFLFFGSGPGDPPPSIEDFPLAKHTKGNAQGVKKKRPHIRILAKGRFRSVETIEELYGILFGR